MRRRKNQNEEDPDVYIKKAFGKNFEFSEKYLTSKMESKAVVKALKRRYGFRKVTRATIKHVLYEGARINHVLRINDSCFEKMVDILELDADLEDEENGNKNLHILV